MPWPLGSRDTISGARYSGVPQKENVRKRDTSFFLEEEEEEEVEVFCLWFFCLLFCLMGVGLEEGREVEEEVEEEDEVEEEGFSTSPTTNS